MPQKQSENASRYGSDEMKKNIYNSCKLRMIDQGKPLELSNEEFLLMYHRSVFQDDIDFTNYLDQTYPKISDKVFSDQFTIAHLDPEDQEIGCGHPILCPSFRNTEGRIANMVFYLTGRPMRSTRLRYRLRHRIPYRLFFNYIFKIYVRDYESVPLWNDFFKGDGELSRLISLHKVSSLEMLVDRTMTYFENKE